jgi:pyrroloquinoline quinone biosynthesis protein B
MLTSADVDCLAGLLHLREFQPLHIYATAAVRRILAEENSMFRVLERANPPAVWHDMVLDKWVPLSPSGSSNRETSLRYQAMSLGGSYPDYVSDGLRRTLPRDEAVMGLMLSDGDKQMFYAPSLPGRSDEWKDRARSSDLCMLDGTFWTEQELISTGASSKTAREIGHVSLSGESGLLKEFGPVGQGTRVLIHINNTNPILDEESPEHLEVCRAGWEIAYDGMEFQL